MTQITISTIFLLFTFVTKAQYLHSPRQIAEIMQQSDIVYHIDSIVPSADTSLLPILSFEEEVVMKPHAELVDLQTMNLGKRPKKYLHKANHSFLEGNYNKAQVFYLKLLGYSSSPMLKARLAYCFQLSQKTEEAIVLYKQLILRDYGNAYFHLQLANCYRSIGNTEDASYHIGLAHIFNRNAPAYLDTLNSIYKASNRKYRLLDFEPAYHISTENNQVNIVAATGPWLAYASCKAVWAHEEKYREKMRFISNEDSNIVEEKECLFNALVAFEALDKPKRIDYPGLYTLSKALPDKRINDFILYEITLRKNPELAAKLSYARLDKLLDYIQTYRMKDI